MRKINFALAALSVIAVAAPTIASAEDIVVRAGGDREMHRDRDEMHGEMRGARAEYRHDRGMHRGWHHADRIVVVKHRHHRED